MIISVCNSIISDNEIEQNETKMYQLGGGGGSIEERCSSITFEDILPYTCLLYTSDAADD